MGAVVGWQFEEAPSNSCGAAQCQEEKNVNEKIGSGVYMQKREAAWYAR